MRLFFKKSFEFFLHEPYLKYHSEPHGEPFATRELRQLDSFKVDVGTTVDTEYAPLWLLESEHLKMALRDNSVVIVPTAG